LLTVKNITFHPLALTAFRNALILKAEIYSSEFLNFSKLLKSRRLDGGRDSKLVSILHVSVRKKFGF